MDSICDIKRLYNSSLRPLAVFVGSGLSVSEPSSLPVCKEAIVSLLNLDWVEGEEKFPIPESHFKNSDLFNIRFEHMLSIFNEWNKHNLGDLLRQFADAPPNWYHKQIATLCEEQIIGCIITTNFDNCLEKALKEQEIPYNVIVTEQDKYSENPNITNIFKIHGTIENLNNRYSERGLCSTLESISNGLDEWKTNLLQKLIDQYTFVILGYSGSDSYDINPVFYERSNNQIFWVSHKSKDDTKPITPEVSHILTQSIYSRPLQINTAVFLGGNPLPSRKSQFKFIPSYNLKNHWHPSVFVGRVLESINDYESALSYYETVLEKSTGSLYWMVEILNLIRGKAVCLYELKDYKSASGTLLMAKMVLIGYNKRMDSDKSTPEEFKKQIFLDQYLLISEEEALIDSALGKTEEAIEKIDQSFQCLESMEFKENVRLSIESRLLLNRCSIKMQLFGRQNSQYNCELLLALEDLKKACRIKNNIGDISGLIKGYGLLGQYYVFFKELNEAENILLKMFAEIQKLRTPVHEKIIDPAIEFLGIMVYLRLALNKDVNIIQYIQNESNTALQFKRRIKNLLTKEVNESNNQALQRILNDGEILSFVNEMKKEIGE